VNSSVENLKMERKNRQQAPITKIEFCKMGLEMGSNADVW
jgi:hypothetical protein